MIILASASPRRKEILELAGFEFKVMPTDVDENLPYPMSPGKTVEYLSKIKAMPLKNNEDMIIGSDTVVAIDGKIIGKPKDEEDAFNILKTLSGRTHCVYTGVTILFKDKEITFSEKTDVEFYEFSDKEILDYIATKEPMDKAGAYGVQGTACKFVKKINGDYFNVIGFPVARFYNVYKNLMNI